MRIGHYADDPLAQGGIASYIRRLATAQRQRGDEVILFSREAPPAQASSTVERVADAASLFQAADQRELDVLHLHRAVDEVPADRVPTVYTMHDNRGSCPSGSRFLARSEDPCDRDFTVAGCLWGHLVDHCGSRRPHKILENYASIKQEQHLASLVPTMTVSDYVRTSMIDSGAPADQLHTVHSPAPIVPSPVLPPPRQGPPRLIYVGRIEPNKGLDWFLRALARCPTVVADIAGAGTDEYVAFMKRRTNELGITDRVTFHGWLSESEVYALYRRARAVVVPSLWHEPAGLVTLEAAACGRPVIASRVGGIPEYASSSFALLCEPGRVGELAEHITTLAADWETAWLMGRAGRTAATTDYTVPAFLTAVDQIYALAESERGAAPVSPTSDLETQTASPSSLSPEKQAS
jgi:glycosyltransferase involved in cell wall biosynthesis